MDDATRRYAERLVIAAPDLLGIAKRFLDLYGGGGPKTAFDQLEMDAQRLVDDIEGEED